MSKKSRSYSFATTPSVNMSRSKFSLSYGTLTSGSLGKLIPFYHEEVLPGDTFKIKSDIVCRLSSEFLKPVFGNIFLDTYYFFVPSRLVFDDWSSVFGENKESSWVPQTITNVPTLPSNQSVVSGSVADYFGLPIGRLASPINPLLFRSFALIWNEYFRDENFIDPVLINKGNITASEYLNSDAWSPSNYTGMLPPVSKMHDYFTSVLPSPQKGSSVDVSPSGFLPLIADPNTGSPLHSLGGNFKFNPQSGTPTNNFFPLNVANSTFQQSGISVGRGEVFYAEEGTASASNTPVKITQTNVGVMSNDVSVNQLRLAFQTQKMLEKDARYGTRYAEYLLGHFGVSASDSRLQRPEFLGGHRKSINIQQVASTSATSGEDAISLGSLGAYSLTNSRSNVSKAFTEHGFIIGCCCFRQFHSYQNGIHKSWLRSSRLDYYDPVFANIGEQPVKTVEIYGTGTSVQPTDVFGYQEAWADYRFHPNEVTGNMRSGISNSLDIWNLSDYYTNAPVAGEEFLTETPVYLDRGITVESTVQDQFIMDIWNNVDVIRVMPVRSIPGLIDHH